MKRSVFACLFLFTLAIANIGCVKSKKTDVAPAENKEYKSDSLRLVESNQLEANYRIINGVNHFYVNYLETINGYTISTECIKNTHLDDGSWRAVLKFKKKTGIGFSLIDSSYNVYNLFEHGVTNLSNDTVISMRYPNANSNDTLRVDVPFFFSDVNFDGKMELILNIYGCAQRGGDMFQVYALKDNGNIQPATKQITYQKPYVDFDVTTTFNKKEQTVTNIFSGGAYDFNYETFVIDEEKSVCRINRFALKKIDIWENGKHRVSYSKKDLLTGDANYLHQRYYDSTK